MAKPLPRIACFHGGGSTDRIFAVQCAGLMYHLKNTFEFVFFSAPFTRSAGPGVLPFFTEEEYGPYGTWFLTDEDGKVREDGSGFDRQGTTGIERVWEMMREHGEGEREKKGEWVAALGFSQGTRIVGGLLLDQQISRETGFPRDIELKFGVLCMGSAAPMVSEVSRDPPQAIFGKPASKNKEPEKISTPTIHIHGYKDKALFGGREQFAKYFDPKTATKWEIDYHHAMPWVKDDLMGLVNRIKDMWTKVQVKEKA